MARPDRAPAGEADGYPGERGLSAAMDEEDARQDDEVYRLLGMLFVSISRLEHCLDRAFLSINDTHPEWLLKVSPEPPTSVWPKIKLVTKFVAEDQLSLGIKLEPDFKTVMDNIFKLRNALLHGDLRGWVEPIEHPETAIYVTRLVKDKKSDQHCIGLSIAIVRSKFLKLTYAKIYPDGSSHPCRNSLSCPAICRRRIRNI